MNSLSKFEKLFILLAFVTGLIGGVLLIYFNFPAIVSSVFIATGIATIVYHILGGIESAKFSLGPIKLTGSIAALLGCAWFINYELTRQTTNPDMKLTIFRDYSVYNQQKEKIGSIEFESVKVNNEYKILINDSIEIGKIEIASLIPADFFNDIDLVQYLELNYNITLNPFGISSNFQSFGDKVMSDYQNAYEDMPFVVEPKFSEARGIHTVITDKANIGTVNFVKSISSGWYQIIGNIDKNIYLIRLRASNVSEPEKGYFANYQILKFSKKTEK